MKKSIFLILIVISLMMQLDVVKADVFDGDANTVGGSVNAVDKQYGNWWSGYEGIRVYVVDKNGDLKSSVVDYSNYSVSSGYYHNGKRTKFDYINTSSIEPTSSGYSYKKPISPLPSFIGTTGGNVIYNYFMSMASDTNDKITELLLDIGFKGDVTTIKEKEYYLVVEPIAYFTYAFKNYALTATETALFLTRAEANTPYNINNNGFCVSCISNLTHKNLPLSIYIKDNHLGLTGENPSVAIMDSSAITGRNGLGIGVFWLDEFLNRKPPTDTSGKCLPNINTPTVCGQNGSYSDNSDWTNCVYKWDRELAGASKWCDIHCREDVNTNFPGDIQNAVKAGQHFIWEPIGISGKKECRTTGLTNSNSQTTNNKIDLARWLKEWNTVNDQIPGLYDTWQIAKKKQEAIDEAFTRGKPSTSCDCIQNKGGFTCCVSTGTRTRTSCSGEGANRTCHTTTYTVCESYDRSTSNRYDQYTPNQTYYAGDNITPRNWCSNRSPENPNEPTKRNNYNNAVNTKNTLEKAIVRCNNWMNDINYNLDTDITINFEYLGNPFDITLEKQITEKRTTSYCLGNNCKGSSTASSRKLTSYDCTRTSVEGCYRNRSTKNYIFTMPYNDLITLKVEKNIDYSIPNETFRYVLKPTGESVSKKPSSNYIDIGYGNLPVHYTTLQGTKPISLIYSNVGEDYHFDKDLAIDSITGKRGVYRCVYNVIKGINPDPGDEDSEDPDPGEPNNPGKDKADGLRLIYRPISLSYPFPALDGKGRVPGTNWLPANVNRLSYKGSNYPIDVVKKYITQNRGVTTNEIYNKKPMYEIELDPVRIKAIRDYNRTTNYDDFNLTCIAGTGRECKSKFIRETFVSYFTTGVNGSSTSTCGLSNNFKACDVEDGITR